MIIFRKQFSLDLLLLLVFIAIALIAAGVVVHYWYETSQELEEINKNLETARSEQEPGETAGWKTYVNTKYGYQIKVPKDFLNQTKPSGWRDTSEDDSIIFLRKEKGGLQWYLDISHLPHTSSYNPPAEAELVSWLRGWKILPPEYQELEKPNFEIDGVPAVRISSSDEILETHNIDEVFFIKHSKLFKIQILAISEDTRRFCGLIISTIKFEEVVPSPPEMLDIDVPAVTGTPYTVGWTAVRGATVYNLERDTDTAFSNPITVYSGPLNDFTETLLPSASVTPYYFRVKACNDYGCSSWSKTVGIEIEVRAF